MQMKGGAIDMFLNTFSTTEEKAAFANLALAVAKADGGIEFEEVQLLRQYLSELGYDYHDFHFLPTAPSDACRCFTTEEARHIAFVNLLAVTTSNMTGNARQQALLHSIAQALYIKETDEKACFDWLNHVNGSDRPDYFE